MTITTYDEALIIEAAAKVAAEHYVTCHETGGLASTYSAEMFMLRWLGVALAEHRDIPDEVMRAELIGAWNAR